MFRLTTVNVLVAVIVVFGDFCSAFGAEQYQKGRKVMTVREAKMMIGSDVTGSIEAGTVLTLKQVRDKWLWVTVDGRSGWIDHDDVRRLDLLEAAAAGDVGRVQELLDGGAFVDTRDKPSEIQVAVSPSGQITYVGPEGNLKLKTDDGQEMIIEPPPGSKIIPLYPGKFTPLIRAAGKGHLEVVELLVERKADLDAQCGTGATALIEASTNGHAKVVQFLLEKGADATLKTKGGQTALYWAAENKHEKVISLLKAYGAKQGDSNDEAKPQDASVRRIVSETLLDSIDFSSWVSGTLAISPDSRRMAYVRRSGSGGQVVVDGQAQRVYDDLGGAAVFSPDSRRIAYAARKGTSWLVVVDGKEGRTYDDLGDGPIFSPNSERVAYGAKRGTDWFVVTNGQEGTRYEGLGKDGLAFSPDSQRLAFVIAERGKNRLVVDGEVGKGYYGSLPSGFLCFSPDSKRVACVASMSEGIFVLVDGKAGKAYDAVGESSLCFSPDGRRMAYGAMLGDKWFVVVDGKEAKAYDKLAGSILFSPDSRRVAYGAGVGNQGFVVLDDTEGKTYDGIGRNAMLFSHDSKRLAYVAGRGRKQFVVVDGQEEAEYDTILSGTLAFSPDNKHLAYGVRVDDRQLVVVDGEPGKPYDGIVTAGSRNVIFDSPNEFHYLAQRGSEIHLVVERLPATVLSGTARRTQPRDSETDGVGGAEGAQPPARAAEIIQDSAQIKLFMLALGNRQALGGVELQPDGRIVAVQPSWLTGAVNTMSKRLDALLRKYDVDLAKCDVKSEGESSVSSGSSPKGSYHELSVTMDEWSDVITVTPPGKLPTVKLKSGSLRLSLPSLDIVFEEGAVCRVNGTEYVFRKGNWSASASSASALDYRAFSLKVARQRVESAGEHWRQKNPEVSRLGGINKVVGIIEDDEADDLILIGKHEEGRAALTLDDFAVALRARLVHGAWPTVSTDFLHGEEDAQTVAPAYRKVRYSGGVQDTQFGIDLLAVECRLIQVVEGVVSVPVRGFKSYRQLVNEQATASGPTAEDVVSRFWLYPINPQLALREEVGIVRNLRAGVFTEVLSAKVSGEPVKDLSHFQYRPSEAFAENLSKEFDELCLSFYSFNRFRGLLELVAVSEALKEMDQRRDLSFWVEEYQVEEVKTPKQVDVLSWKPSAHQLVDAGTFNLTPTSLPANTRSAALVLRIKAGDILALREAILMIRPSSASLCWSLKLDNSVAVENITGPRNGRAGKRSEHAGNG